MKKAEISLQFLILGVIGVFILGIIFLNPAVMDFIAEKLPRIIPFYNDTKPQFNSRKSSVTASAKTKFNITTV